MYDLQNRAIKTGEYVPSPVKTYSQLQAEVGGSFDYIPSVRSALTYNYYDDYSFTGASMFDSSRNISGYADNDGTVNGYFDNITGLVTGTKVKVLDGTGNNYGYNIRNWLTGIHGSKFEMDLFYDDLSSFSALDTMAMYNGTISGIS